MFNPQFGIGERLKVPYSNNTQAVVVACYGRPDGLFDYALRFVGDNGCVCDHTYSEQMLRNENPTPEQVVAQEEIRQRASELQAQMDALEARTSARAQNTRARSRNSKAKRRK